MHKIADKHEIHKRIRYNQRVTKLQFDDKSYTWLIETSKGKLYKANYVVSAVGQLHHPNIIQIDGSETFKGDIIHKAEFGPRRRTLEYYKDKNVALVGNGASAIQILPELQHVCKQVYLFCRTPNYVHPRLVNFPTIQKIVNCFPFLRQLHRCMFQFLTENVLFRAIQGSEFCGLVLKQSVSFI